ncbi:MAG: DUF1284 domain-containing protein [Ruminococcus sp.]|nr:DUF1284 domain-containing protein [Ruminococcus sp.]MCM1480226.1 DUF1284 domain-containing protein [Muribaculaceae bacterium]
MKKQLETVQIRPHHGLCAEFFRGEGYSGEFSQNMAKVLKMLNETDPTVSPKAAADLICGHCPNNAGGVCSTEEKVLRYDKKVLEICGIAEGAPIKWSEFRRLAAEKIVSAGKLGEVCGDCGWFYICGKIF